MKTLIYLVLVVVLFIYSCQQSDLNYYEEYESLKSLKVGDIYKQIWNDGKYNTVTGCDNYGAYIETIKLEDNINFKNLNKGKNE